MTYEAHTESIRRFVGTKCTESSCSGTNTFGGYSLVGIIVTLGDAGAERHEVKHSGLGPFLDWEVGHMAFFVSVITAGGPLSTDI